MKRFVCHCTVNMFDKGLNDHTTARPTIVVKGEDDDAATQNAIDKLRKDYTNNLVCVTSVYVDVIKEIGDNPAYLKIVTPPPIKKIW